MKKLKLLLLLLLALPALAQTHVSPNLDSNNVFTGDNQFTQGVFVGPTSFSTLGSLIGVTNFIYVSDATANSTPCTSGGTGAMASYINGQWSCGSTGGGSGTLTGIVTDGTSGLQGGGTSGTLTLSLIKTCSVNQILQWNGSVWGCATVSGSTAVTSFSGDGALLSNSASTGPVTATLTTAGAHRWWGNNTGSTATPAYALLTAADIPTLNQSTTGNAATATALAALPVPCSTGQAPTGILANGNSTGCASIAGGGSVSSVGLTQTGAIFNITNTPITTSGNINIAFANGTANQVFATPNGTSGAPTLRAIVSADIPTLNQNTTGSAASFTGSLTGDVTGSQSSTVVGKINGVSLAGLATGIVKNTTSTGVPSIAIAADFPLLNQNTSGTAANLSGTPALPNGTTATTQTVGDNTTKVATDAFVLANAGTFSNPMTTLGDLISENATPAPARLAGPTGPNGVTQSLCNTPASSLAVANAWCIPGIGIDLQTGTTYNIPVTDNVHLLIGSNALATAWTGFTPANNYSFAFENQGAGLITYTPASGTVNGVSTQIIPSNYFGFHYTNNTNTFMPVLPTIAAFADCNGTGKAETFVAATGVFGCNTISGSGSSLDTITGSAALNTATEVAAGDIKTFAGVETAALTYPYVFTNNSASNNSSGAVIIATTGAGTAQVPLVVNEATAAGDLADFISGGTVTNGVLSGGTNELAIAANGIITASNQLQSAKYLAKSTTIGTTFGGGQNITANVTSGITTLGGNNITSGSGAAAIAGSIIVNSGNSANTSATSQAGSLELLPGISTGATQGLQGLFLQGLAYVKGATVTQWNLECESAAMTVTDCGASPTTVAGVAEVVNTNTVQLIDDGQIPITASGAVTLGHTVCAGASASHITDSGGTAACTTGPTMGTVMATAGAWTLPDGTTFTATTTLPLIQLGSFTLAGAGGVTSIATTSPITGGTITTTGTIGCATCGVTGSPLNQFAATTSAQLAGIISDETGTGAAVFATSPTLVSPLLGTPTSGVLTNATGYLENNLTGASAAATITEGAATASVTRAGIATANLTAPWVIQNTNSSNNNTSITLGITSPGTSTGQTTLNVNGAATGGDLADFGTGGTWTAGVLSGQTIVAKIAPSGNFTATGTASFGASPPTCSGASQFALCGTEGTGPTGASNVGDLYPNSADHNWYIQSNAGVIQHFPQMLVVQGTPYTNATTSFTTVAGSSGPAMSWTVAASTPYAGHCFLIYSASVATAGPKIQFTGPASPTLINYSAQFMLTSGATPTYAEAAAATAFSTSLSAGTAVTATTNQMVRIDFTLVNGTTAGTLTLQAASQGVGTLTLTSANCTMQ